MDHEETFQQARALIVGLLEGTASREYAADWAMVRIRDDIVDYASNAVLWMALDRLAGADLQESPGTYLHDKIDFRAWLNEVDHGEA